MMISYKVKSNPLMASNNYDKISSSMTKGYKDKISFPMTKAYRDKVNHLILNDFKIKKRQALMINPLRASERRCCSYD
ncbi:hypothetical protein [Peptoniphilus hominis (ex Hitch et al. 2025)]|uniref:Uncharacterized protein n=1 Tax=Peptoniphilus hominis (ex Hitch et al. 2025) TaxID=3133174 RepID=A0ABV1CE50_9FIRM